MNYPHWPKHKPEKQTPSLSDQFDIVIETIEWLYRTWKIPNQFGQTLQAISQAERRDMQFLVNADFVDALQLFSRWVQSLQWNTPKLTTWETKFTELLRALRLSLSSNGYVTNSIASIWASVTWNAVVRSLPQVSRLDRISEQMLDQHSATLVQYLKQNATIWDYESGKVVSLYTFRTFLAKVGFPTVLSYNNWVKGDFIDDVRHPFWVAFWEKLRNAGYSLQFQSSREGKCIMMERLQVK